MKNKKKIQREQNCNNTATYLLYEFISLLEDVREELDVGIDKEQNKKTTFEMIWALGRNGQLQTN